MTKTAPISLIRHHLILIASLFIWIVPVSADSYQDGGITVEDMTGILQEKGYQAVLRTTENKVPSIKSSANGHNYYIYFYEVGENQRAKSIEFSYGVALDVKIPQERISQWNKKFRFGRAYLDDENDPFVEMDLDVERGCTPAMVDNTIDRWFGVLSDFIKYINEK